MAKQIDNRNIDSNDSQVRNVGGGDAAGEQVQQAAGGADQTLTHQAAKLHAEIEEEIDALQVNLTQDDDSRPNTRYGTGIIADDVAEDRLAGATETGPRLDDRGVNNVTPGRDDTSSVLRRHHPAARSENVVEGNLDEPRDEALTGRSVDEGAAA